MHPRRSLGFSLDGVSGAERACQHTAYRARALPVYFPNQDLTGKILYGLPGTRNWVRRRPLASGERDGVFEFPSMACQEGWEKYDIQHTREGHEVKPPEKDWRICTSQTLC